MICLDAPEFLGTFWGAIKIGAVPVPVNTLLRAAGLPATFSTTAAPGWPSSRRRSSPRRRPASRARGISAHVLVAGGAPGPHLSCEDRVARASRIPRGRADLARRRRVLALLVRVDGPPQGRRPPPPRHGRRRRDLREAGARHPGDRQGLLGRQALLRLRPRQRGYFPMSVGAQSVLVPAPADPGRRLRADRAPPARRSSSASRRSTPRCSPPRRRERAIRSLVAPALRVRGRGAAGGPLPALARALRRGDRRRHRHDRDRPHLPLEPARGRAARGRRACRSPATSARSSTTRAAR